MDERADVIVVGGGIQGAGTAQAAAAAGHAVLVLEKQQALAEGTSGRSSKLIHGGLRYLEGAHFSLVRESLRERAGLLRLAPDLVKLQPFHFPIYRGTRRRSWQVRLGLTLYALLGGLRRENRFARVPRNQWDALDGLKTAGLRTVYRYFDAQTDDARLTRAVMRSACALGARLAMPAELLGAELVPGGCTVRYRHNATERVCAASVLVNAAGPWAGRVLERVSPRPAGCPVELVQGAHIVVPGTLERGIYYVEAPQDGRAVFCMPWGDRTLVGTTETPFSGDPDEVRPRPQEIAYLSEVLAHYFPSHRGGVEVLESFAGLRVLPAGTGSLSGRSRETILETDRPDRPRLLTIHGGKLTTYRTTAAKALERIGASLPERAPVADTATLALPVDEEAP